MSEANATDGCGSCRFYLGYQCKRRAPVAGAPRESSFGQRFDAVFPSVGERDWCGEYQGKRQVDVEISAGAHAALLRIATMCIVNDGSETFDWRGAREQYIARMSNAARHALGMPMRTWGEIEVKP